MHPSIKKILITTPMAVLGLLALAQGVQASGPLSVDTSVGIAPAFGDSNHGGYSNTWVSDGIYNSTSTQVFVTVSGGPRVLELDIGTGGNYSTDYASATSSCSTGTWCVFTYPQKFFLPKTYTFTIWDPLTSGNNFNVWYGVGNATGQRNSFGSWAGGDPVGMAMQIGSAEPAAPTVSFIYPIDGQMGNDFTDWNIQYTSPQGAFWNGHVGVSYGQSSTTLNTTDVYKTGVYNPTTHTLYFPKTVAAPTATTSIWYAKAFFKDLNDNIVAQTSIIQFGISGWGTDNTGTTTPNVANTNPYATSSPWFVDCSAYTGISAMSAEGFGCYIVKSAKIVGQFLFEPDTIFQEYLNAMIFKFQHTFPQSLYYTVRDGIASSTAGLGTGGATTSIAVPVWLNVHGSTTPSGYITVLSKAQLDAAFGAGNWDTLMAWVSRAMWFAWIIVVLYMVIDGELIFPHQDY